MSVPARSFVLIPAAFACTLCIAPAQAQSRVFVAGQGSDGNPCTFALPCRTFQHAHDTVAPNGEIDVLDPAGYGALKISKAISIQGHGFSGISAASGVAITIGAGPGDEINLRGLLIDGLGTGDTGISFNSGASLNVQDCLIRHFTNSSIGSGPTNSNTLLVSNTILSDTGQFGLKILGPAPGATANAFVDHVLMQNNGNSGLIMIGSAGTLSATVAGSAAVSNTKDGFHVQSSDPGPIQLMLRDSTSANNGNIGVVTAGTNPGLVVRVTRSTITGNSTGFLAFSGHLLSFGDNSLAGNTTEGTPTGTVALQ